MSRFGKGALLMILSALGFSAMQIAIAKTAQGIPLFEQLFFRNLFACIAAFVSLRRKNLAAFGKRENRGLLVFRSAAGYAGMIALFYASGHAAQGDVAIINKMSPFVVTVLACLFLKEKFTAYQGVALGLAFGGALMLILSFVVYKTKIGKAMRCTSQNAEAARLMGISVNRVIAFTFIISGVLACISGNLVGMYYQTVDITMGASIGMKTFASAILGGVGVLPGAMVGGLVVGVIETFAAGYISSGYRDAISFVVLILVLLIKPSGLFGSKQINKV